MSPDPGSLQNLRDIAVSPPVSWWPLAVGWWVVLALVLIATLYCVLRAWQKWQANAYRRAALAALEQTDSPWGMLQILKRTALCIYPRTDIASLSGRAWCDWLDQVSGQTMQPTTKVYLSGDSFRDAAAMDQQELRGYVSGWIRLHQAPTKEAGEERSTC